MGFVIASRKSDLARIQAYQVGEALKAKFPDLDIQYHFRESLGDQNQNDPLWKMPEKGVFTEDFREGLIKGEWDMVVHSWKDLPTEIPEGTEIAGTLPRADMRDLFLFKRQSFESLLKSRHLKIYTSSPRRIYNLKDFFMDCFPSILTQVEFEPVRGNMNTRVRKMMENENIDGLILAKAALDRLLAAEQEEFQTGKAELLGALKQCQWMVLPLTQNPTAAAQGALAIEISKQRDDLKKYIQAISCQQTFENVSKERQILKSYGGGCHQKIGVSCITRDYGQLTFLKGKTDAGEVLNQRTLKGPSKIDFQQDNSFPADPKDAKWFERLPVEFDKPSGNAHLISRANALPLSEKFSEDEVVWVPGPKTWMNLAQRGIWVNGSFEGLGEREEARLEVMAPDLKWSKWTHKDSPPSDQYEKVATYELRPMQKAPDTQGKKNFYWMSGSSFQQALETDPEILDAQHYCGPGNTFTIIDQVLKENNAKGQLHIALSFDHWKALTWKRK